MTDASLEETISAALDGERVDLAVLRQALARADGRELCASFVVLRAAAAADPLEADERVSARTRAAMQRSNRVWFGGGFATRLALAASLAALMVTASFWLGGQWGRGAARSALPGGTPGALARPASATQPPSPTRVLRFQPGVDWRDGV